MSTKLEVINHDILTKDGWTNFVTEQAKRTAEVAVAGEVKLADVLLMVQNDPRTGEPLPHISGAVFATFFMGDTPAEVEQAKESFVMLVRSAAIVGHAIASIMTSETWLVEATTEEEAIEAQRVRPVNHPNRRDAMCMMVDHRDFGKQMLVAMLDITTTPRKIEPWVDRMAGRTDTAEGRMSSFVPPPRMLDPRIVEMARIHVQHEMQRNALFAHETKNVHAPKD